MAGRRVGGAVGAAVIVLFTTSACFDGPVIDFGQDCQVDADCEGYTPPFDGFYDDRCNEALCENRRCATRPRDIALRDDVDGDCYRPTCKDGAVSYVYSGTDSPNSYDACRVGRCTPAGPSTYDFLPDGTSCSGGVCRLGMCVPAETDAGTDGGDAGEAASDAGNDAG